MAMGDPAENRGVVAHTKIKHDQGEQPVVAADANSSTGDRETERLLVRFAAEAASNPTSPPSIPLELESVLREISATGVPYYGWGGLKELLAVRMTEVVESLNNDVGFRQLNGGKAYDQRRDDLMKALRSFDAAPFTLQRLVEVLQEPRRQYSSTHKLMNGLERLLAVSTTIPLRTRKGTSSNSSSLEATDPANAATTNGVNETRPRPIHGLGRMEVKEESGRETILAVKVEPDPALEAQKVLERGSEDMCDRPDGSTADVLHGPAGRKRLKVENASPTAVMSE